MFFKRIRNKKVKQDKENVESYNNFDYKNKNIIIENDIDDILTNLKDFYEIRHIYDICNINCPCINTF